jgi:pimeloyl-ACP methyl ester carboxylesterase
MQREEFRIAVPDEELEDLRARLEKTRWPDAVEGAGWEYGTELEFAKTLCRYWAKEFDWRAQETRLNRLRQFRVPIDGLQLHFVHEPGKAPGRRPLPLLLLHGFPDSFWRFERIIPRLTDPARFGAHPEEAFDVIVPSLPGFGFSDRAQEPGMTPRRIAALLAQLMRELGYERYAVHGGDWGSQVADELGKVVPDALLGAHHTEVGWQRLFALDPNQLSEAERAYVEAGKRWQQAEGAYALIQATKPQSLAYAMTDSPAGLAAWIVEKLRAWSDSAGEVERRFSKDELLTNISIYWFTRTAGSAFRLYFETLREAAPPSLERDPRVPRAFAIFPKDMVNAPREFAERFYDVRRWTAMPRGGHFAAFEEPDLLAEDLRAFFFHDATGRRRSSSI